MRFCLGIITALFIAGPAFAGEPYITIGGEVGDTQTQTPTEAYTATALNGRLGFDFGDHFGIEGEGALFLGASATFVDGNAEDGREFERKVKDRLGIFLRGRAPVSERVSIFGRVGLGGRKETYTFRSFGTYLFDGSRYDQTSMRAERNIYGAIGVGGEFHFAADDRNAIRADFTRYSTYIGGEDQDITTAGDSVFSLAYLRKF